METFILSEIFNRLRLFNSIDSKNHEFINRCRNEIHNFIIDGKEHESNDVVENIPIIKCKNNILCVWTFFTGLKFNFLYFEFIIYESKIFNKYYIDNQTVAYINETIPLNINKYEHFKVKI